MDGSPIRRGTRTRAAAGTIAVILMALLGGGALLGCSSGQGGAGAAPTTMRALPTQAGGGSSQSMGAHAMMTADEAASMWNARPAYVRGADSRVQEAYAFALAAGGAIQYMPCYCGCVAMDHRSNLDCFLRRSGGTGPAAFEEHASFCDVCIETALMTKRMLAGGSSLSEIRAAVDATFGGRAPGTETELPPS